MRTLLSSKQGHYQLARFPIKKNDPLRAWDAGDELALDHLFELDIPNNPKFKSGQFNTLIINDQFGALSTALHTFSPSMMSDSFIAEKSTQYNLQNNQKTPLEFISSVQPLNKIYDLVIIKIQKSLSQLEEQLLKIRLHLHADSIIIGCAMVKMIHTSTLNLFTHIIGPTTTSLAKKKARLVFCQLDENLPLIQNPYPVSYQLEPHDWQIFNHANVFSRNKLDIGCRFFIEHIPFLKQAKRIVDLGCGNGIVGLVAAHMNPQAQIDFYDESYMAVASAEQNFKNIFCEQRQATFNIGDCLSSSDDSSVDLILNNPPFHQQNAIGDFIALQMFSQSFKALASGGQLWVIGNKHLDYQQKLKKLFGNCVQVTANQKFVILKAVKK